MTEIGLERLAKDPKLAKDWGRVGLVSNQASVTRAYVPAWKVCRDVLGDRLVVLFGPQHGMTATLQENMIETDHSTHLETGLTIYSLYSETREPTAEMLHNIDTIVFDLPVTGCRIYTYKYTLSACLRAAKRFKKKVVVLDRPNPLGGIVLEGNVLNSAAQSFVGEFEIPMRHALTMAEAARFFNQSIGADLSWIEVVGWDPHKTWTEQDDREWVISSPNLPTISSCYTFPGTVLFEGTNVSEGRGTTLPFQFIGAPFIKDPRALVAVVERLGGYDHSKIHLRPTSFQPTSSKWRDTECRGVQIHIKDAADFLSFKLGAALLRAFIECGDDQFKWRDPPYEYENRLLPIAIIMGAVDADKWFTDSKFDLNDAKWSLHQTAYWEQAQKILLYRR